MLTLALPKTRSRSLLTPHPSELRSSTFPPRGKVSQSIIFRKAFGLRALKLPPTGVNRNKRRYNSREYVNRGGRFPKQQSFVKTSGCVPLSFPPRGKPSKSKITHKPTRRSPACKNAGKGAPYSLYISRNLGFRGKAKRLLFKRRLFICTLPRTRS